ncbi:MAG: PEP-CTERM sorting domain-containing protein [Opitutales bacterium]|nr:PEP-CTERM sorting domain-containing protein [Opitutales bacterium]
MIFSENFNQITTSGTAITEANTAFTGHSFTYSSITSLFDTNDYFGEGTGNTIARFVDGDTSFSARVDWNGGSTARVFTLSFDFFLSNPTAYADNQIQFDLFTSTDFASLGAIGSLMLNADGTADFRGTEAFSFSMDTKHSLRFVCNISDASLTDYHSGADLGVDKVDIWLDGLRVASDLAISTSLADGASFQGFRMRTGRVVRGPAYVDNVEIVSGAVPVPEPSSIALFMGVAGLAFVTYSRRRA